FKNNTFFFGVVHFKHIKTNKFFRNMSATFVHVYLFIIMIFFFMLLAFMTIGWDMIILLRGNDE
ncbi:hypothetical protein ACJX0J_013449, partial [Zea mays]